MMSATQSRRLLLNLLLLVLVGGLVWLAGWWSGASQIPAPDHLLPLTLDQVEQIEIERNPAASGTDVISLHKQGEGWQITQPQSMAANPVRVRQLLTLLDEPIEARYAAAGKDLQQYALDPGNVVVDFNQERVVLGMMNPVSNKRYARHADQIMLVADNVFGMLTGSWLDFAALKLVPADFIVKSVQLPAGHPAADTPVMDWQSAEAVRLEVLDATNDKDTDDKAGAYAGLPRIVLHSTEGASMEFVVLASEDELILGDVVRGIRFIVPAEQGKQLLPPG